MTTIKLEDNVAQIVLKAITDRMSHLNSFRTISGILTDGMAEEHECLEEAYKAISDGIGKEEKVYVVDSDYIPDEKVFSQLTDDEVKDISLKRYDSVKGFMNDFNADYLDPSSQFVRVIKE